MTAYAFTLTWIAIILAGIAGCVATAFVANTLKDVPLNAVAGNWAKYVWSIIFCIPIPFLLGIGPFIVGLILAFIWLVLAPTVASKAHFGPKDLPAMTLNTFHAGFAVVALVVYLVVISLG